MRINRCTVCGKRVENTGVYCDGCRNYISNTDMVCSRCEKDISRAYDVGSHMEWGMCYHCKDEVEKEKNETKLEKDMRLMKEGKL